MELPPPSASRRAEVTIAVERDVVACRKAVSRAMDALGTRASLKTRFVTAVSEIARNALVHGGGGKLSVFADASVVYVVCEDQGSGIPNIEQAMQDGFTTGKSLGKGLGGAKRLSSRLVIETGSSGTTVRMASG